jgi:hypothetical protein
MTTNLGHFLDFRSGMEQVWPFFCDYKLRQCSLGSRRFETTILPVIVQQFLTA